MKPKVSWAHTDIIAMRRPFYFYELLPEEEKKAVAKRTAKWNKNNREKRNGYSREWQKNNSEKIRESREKMAKKQGCKDFKEYKRRRKDER